MRRFETKEGRGRGRERTETAHDLSQICRGDVALAGLGEHLECLLDFIIGTYVVHLVRHDREILLQGDRTLPTRVDPADHVLWIGLGGILAQRAHNVAELLGGNHIVFVFQRHLRVSNGLSLHGRMT